MSTKIFHSKKFRNGRLVRVVTGVYSLENGLLKFAGAIYDTRYSPNPHKIVSWNKNEHIKTAQQRYNSSPHVINFDPTQKLQQQKWLTDLQQYYLEKFMRYIFINYGVQHKDNNPASNADIAISNYQKVIFSKEASMDDHFYGMNSSQRDDIKHTIHKICKPTISLSDLIVAIEAPMTVQESVFCSFMILFISLLFLDICIHLCLRN